jgi:hypothetical protein
MPRVLFWLREILWAVLVVLVFAACLGAFLLENDKCKGPHVSGELFKLMAGLSPLSFLSPAAQLI